MYESPWKDAIAFDVDYYKASGQELPPMHSYQALYQTILLSCLILSCRNPSITPYQHPSI